MLKALLKYFSLALVVHLVTGVFTKVTELYVLGGVLTDRQFGVYQHYLLVVEIGAGTFIAGFEHALVTFINRRTGNYRRFLHFFLRYAALLVLLGGIVALAASRYFSFATVLALLAVGPFVVAELGKLIFRARMEQNWELSLQAVQSLFWSIGCTLTVVFWTGARAEGSIGWLPSWVPLVWAFGGTVVTAALILALVARRLSTDDGESEGTGHFGAGYSSLWADYRHLWVGGMAYIVNIQFVKLMVEGMLGREALGRYGYVASVMLFVQKPLSLVQRAALPLFTRHPEEVPNAFRSLVRINLTVFPLIAIAILGGYDYLLSLPRLAMWRGTWSLLAIIISSAPMFAVEYLVATVAMATGRAVNTKYANVGALFINVPMVWILVGQFGLTGAALSAMAYPLIFGSLMFLYNRRDLPEYVSFALIAILRSLAWIWVAIGFLWQMEQRYLWMPVAALIYLGGATITGLWSPSQLRYARRFLLRQDSED